MKCNIFRYSFSGWYRTDIRNQYRSRTALVWLVTCALLQFNPSPACRHNDLSWYEKVLLYHPANVWINLYNPYITTILTSCFISKACRLLNQPSIHVQDALMRPRPQAPTCPLCAPPHFRAVNSIRQTSKLAYMQTNTEAAYKIQLEFLGGSSQRQSTDQRQRHSTCSHPIMICSSFLPVWSLNIHLGPHQHMMAASSGEMDKQSALFIKKEKKEKTCL